MNIKKRTNHPLKFGILILASLLLTGCGSSVKVINSWKGDQTIVDKFKQSNVLVIARTANKSARIAFESEITDQLLAKGIKATPSFSKAPNLRPQVEVTEERIKFMRSLIETEGFHAIVLTVVKDKSQTTVTESSGVYVGASYGGYYPGYYGSFYGYYAAPYAYGPYYSAAVPVGGSTTTRVETDYVLETVMYNLDQPEKEQLVAVVTTKLDDPKDAYKAAEKYVAKVTESLSKK